MRLTIWSLCFCLFFLSANTPASNIVREAAIEKHIKERLKSGTIVDLGEGKDAFYGIYEESKLPLKQGGIILLHDIDQNPDAPQIIRPLRTLLTNNGWDTLSIQMPLAGKLSSRDTYYSLLPQSALRLNAALSFFENKNNTNLGLIGHGMGANMAVNFLSNTPRDSLRGLIAIGMDSENPIILDKLKKIQIPMLDIYGSLDFPFVLNTAAARKRAVTLNAANLNYRQFKRLGADHYFTGLQKSLFTSVRAWLGKNIAGEEVILRKNNK